MSLDHPSHGVRISTLETIYRMREKSEDERHKQNIERMDEIIAVVKETNGRLRPLEEFKITQLAHREDFGHIFKIVNDIREEQQNIKRDFAEAKGKEEGKKTFIDFFFNNFGSILSGLIVGIIVAMVVHFFK